MAQAIPTYSMSCFMLPEGILDEMAMAMKKYWWIEKSKKRGWPLVAWNIICQPKAFGVWSTSWKTNRRLLNNPNSLAFKILKANTSLPTPQLRPVSETLHHMRGKVS
ncbi:hypothetical protein V6N12_068511 [Hibiscus sabdariffa]|uniref:Uncharacterized protein n=1 Tax=Hibiscus sabdariffa TaxID=183260 RepID=A0ABR2FQ94_9ROSI